MPKRPFLVTLLAAAVLLLSIVNLTRAAVGIARWPVFATLPETLPTQISIALGALWGVVWMVEGWELWTLRHRARMAGIALFVLYQIAILGEQALFARGPYERGLIPGAVVTSILLVGLAVLALTRPAVRQAFTSQYEESSIHGR